jgi:hypothetical protein
MFSTLPKFVGTWCWPLHPYSLMGCHLVYLGVWFDILCLRCFGSGAQVLGVSILEDWKKRPNRFWVGCTYLLACDASWMVWEVEWGVSAQQGCCIVVALFDLVGVAGPILTFNLLPFERQAVECGVSIIRSRGILLEHIESHLGSIPAYMRGAWPTRLACAV